MEQNGIFISYQMAEAIELIEGFNLNTPEEKVKAEESLLELKKRWLNDTLPGTNVKIGEKFTGMQDITIEDIIQISTLAKQADTYTLENAGAFPLSLFITSYISCHKQDMEAKVNHLRNSINLNTIATFIYYRKQNVPRF